ncbi:MAG: class I SAM-dependent methyltransferase [Mariprofundaceae bacterium]
MAAQKVEVNYWHGPKVLQAEMEHIKKHFAPILTRTAEGLGEDASILDIGCGPACPAQFIEHGRKTYIDPLLDEFRRAYPAGLPKSKFIACQAEDIGLPDASFDLILSCNALDCMLNPELVLNEVERLLKPGGTFILGIHVYRAIVARFRYYIERFLPNMRVEVRPYSYSLTGIRKTLERHFSISDVSSQPVDGGLLSFLHRQDCVFICHHKDATSPEPACPDR